jgi:hypothetical protein
LRTKTVRNASFSVLLMNEGVATVKSLTARQTDRATAHPGRTGVDNMDLMDLLQDPAYRHMLLNHIPVIGLIIAFVILATGLVMRQTALLLSGLVLIALTSGMSLPVATYGDAAYPEVYDSLDGHGRGWLDYHAELAETWLPLLYANAVLAVIAIMVVAVRPGLIRWASLFVAMLTLGSIVGASIVASAGGKIQHPEFRISDPPRVESKR